MIRLLSFLLLSIGLGNCVSGQTLVYQLEDGTLLNNQEYLDYRVEQMKDDVVGTVVGVKTMSDSIIRKAKFTRMSQMDRGTVQYLGHHWRKIGRPFPLQEVSDHPSSTFEYDDLQGKPTFVNFYFTNCPPCIEEIPMLNYLRDKYKDRVNFIAITFDDASKVSAYSKRFNFEYDQVVSARDLTNQLLVQGFPLNFLLSQDEVQTQVYPMLYDINTVEQDIDALLEN